MYRQCHLLCLALVFLVLSGPGCAYIRKPFESYESYYYRKGVAKGMSDDEAREWAEKRALEAERDDEEDEERKANRKHNQRHYPEGSWPYFDDSKRYPARRKC